MDDFTFLIFKFFSFSYCITASKKYPGKFVLSYLAQSKIRNEYMSVTPEGLRFRKQLFNSTEDCVNWFKVN